MSDWIDDLDAKERARWDEFVDRVRRDALQKMDDSTMVISLVPEKTDIKFAVELGLAIMLDKPIIAVAHPGAHVPHHLQRVVDQLVYADVDTDEGRRKIGDALRRMRPE